MNDVSQKELYRIFNNVLSESSFFKYEGIDEEISLFSKRAHDKWQKDPQLDIFEEQSASYEEIRNVADFCSVLKTYYKEIDKDSYTEDSLSEGFYRLMYRCLEKCKPYVSEENKQKYNTMKRDAQRYLPEYRDKIIIEDYIKNAEEIYKIRQKAQRNKEKRQFNKDYSERLAVHYFNEIKKDNSLREMSYCPEMLVLCEKVLQIVDCLPSNQFGRIKKYEMKVKINKSREDIARSLGGAYDDVANIAVEEQQKFEKAIRTTEKYLQNPKKYRGLTYEERRKKAEEEWKYK